MTPDDRFGRTLSTWLHEEAEHRVPDHLAEVLVQTVATRQRPWWSSLERLTPMTTMTTGRVQARPPVFWFALIALVSLAAVGAVLFAGSLRATPTPLGPASNGRIVVADGSVLYSYAADGSDRRELARFTGGSPNVAVSPDGSRVAFAVNSTPPVIHLVTIADGATTELTIDEVDLIAEEQLGWSPDGRSLVFAGLDGRLEVMHIADTQDGLTRPLAPEGLNLAATLWKPAYSPDGEWIAFGAYERGAGKLYVVHPDGTGLRALETPPLEMGDGGGPVWAPAPDVHRIAYLTFSDTALQTHVFDLDTDTDHPLGEGFWPSWSPDGTRLATCCATIVDVEAAFAGEAEPVTAFGQPGEGYCGEQLDWSGRAICSAVAWSPDGKWLVAGDIAGKDLLLAPVDGSQPPTRIELASGASIGNFRIPVAWQPVWP